jgi:transketolase
VKHIDLARIAWQARRDLLDLAQSGARIHVGSSMSAAELYSVLYEKVARFDTADGECRPIDHVVSCAKSALAYYFLSRRGVIEPVELRQLGKLSSRLDYERMPPHIEMPFGPLGHSLSFACGLAVATRKDGLDSQVYCVLGDGELNEGSVWEAVMTASHMRLSNVMAVVDRNGMQLSGPTDRVKSMGDLEQKFEAFGWDACAVDGRSVDDIAMGFETLGAKTERPRVLIVNTVKGMGISFIEGNARFHLATLTPDEFVQARSEIDAALSQLEEAHR